MGTQISCEDKEEKMIEFGSPIGASPRRERKPSRLELYADFYCPFILSVDQINADIQCGNHSNSAEVEETAIAIVNAENDEGNVKSAQCDNLSRHVEAEKTATMIVEKDEEKEKSTQCDNASNLVEVETDIIVEKDEGNEEIVLRDDEQPDRCSIPVKPDNFSDFNERYENENKPLTPLTEKLVKDHQRSPGRQESSDDVDSLQLKNGSMSDPQEFQRSEETAFEPTLVDASTGNSQSLLVDCETGMSQPPEDMDAETQTSQSLLMEYITTLGLKPSKSEPEKPTPIIFPRVKTISSGPEIPAKKLRLNDGSPETVNIYSTSDTFEYDDADKENDPPTLRLRGKMGPNENGMQQAVSHYDLSDIERTPKVSAPLSKPPYQTLRMGLSKKGKTRMPLHPRRLRFDDQSQ